jgi:2-polyprenyl-3-methyl-5-hydroxy-6-metoxy-1,4-benzoquinol methylase
MAPEAIPPQWGNGRQYWEEMAEKWDDEIFNTLRHDKQRVIATEIARSRKGGPAVADLGCGIGIYVPLLRRLFEEVQGFERSRECVRIARERFHGDAKVSIHPVTASARRQGRFDAVLCVNVAIHPARRSRASVFRTARSLLRPGGTLLLVVPSFESATMVAQVDAARPRRTGATGSSDWDVAAAGDGVVAIEGSRTKHFTKGELHTTLGALGWAVRRIRQVRYSWASQGLRARAPLPWDWIAVATKR